MTLISLTKLEKYSGNGAGIYVIGVEGEEQSRFTQFAQNYNGKYRAEVSDILTRIESIGHKYGCVEYFFKHEGPAGLGVMALFDKPDTNLRLYCIRNGMDNLILGGGGLKPKTVKKWQDDPKLKEEAELVISTVHGFMEKIRDRSIILGDCELLGTLNFEI